MNGVPFSDKPATTCYLSGGYSSVENDANMPTSLKVKSDALHTPRKWAVPDVPEVPSTAVVERAW